MKDEVRSLSHSNRRRRYRMIRIRYGSAELNLSENVDPATVAALPDSLRRETI